MARKRRAEYRRSFVLVADRNWLILGVSLILTAAAFYFGRNIFLPATEQGPLHGQVIFLDPGHGGIDPGACGSRYVEKDIVLKVALNLGVRLEKAGARVVYSRIDDRALGDIDVDDSNARLRLLGESCATMALSIHCNAFSDSREDGAQTFYNAQKHEASKQLAVLVQDELKTETGTLREASTKLDHFILNHSDIPTVTVELGFLSNPGEEELLGDSRYQQKLAAAIFRAVCEFVKGPL